MNTNINNNDDDIKIRHLKDILISSGTGVIMFGVWSVVRTILNIVLINKSDMEAISEVAGGSMGLVVATVLIMLALLGAELGIRLFVGLSARAEGKGKKKSNAYVVVAFIMIPIYVAGIIFSIINVVNAQNGVLDLIVTTAVEITSVGAFVELAISAVRLKRIQHTKEEISGGEIS